MPFRLRIKSQFRILVETPFRTPLSVAQKHVTFPLFLRTEELFRSKKKPKKEVDYFWKHQTSNSRLRHSI